MAVMAVPTVFNDSGVPWDENVSHVSKECLTRELRAAGYLPPVKPDLCGGIVLGLGSFMPLTALFELDHGLIGVVIDLTLENRSDDPIWICNTLECEFVGVTSSGSIIRSLSP